MPEITKVSDLINPEVMADMISAKLDKKLKAIPFAKVDTKLQGQAGNTITVPKYGYIGDAKDVAEGVTCDTAKLSTSTTTTKVKKAMKAVSITDEAVLSGYGNPVGEATNQLAKSIDAKVDNDLFDVMYTAKLKTVADDATIITYEGIVNAVDLFNEEENTLKAMFVHPHQVTQLRKDPNFLSSDKYVGKVMVDGEIGRIANCLIVPTKKVKEVEDNYACLIVKLNEDQETEDELPAVTIYLKRDTNLEHSRDVLARTTTLSVDKHYAAALTNDSKVLIAYFAKEATATPEA